MKAVIETGGKQYTVENGSVLYIEKIDVESGKTVKFDKVLMVDDKVGTPYLDACVTAEVEKHGKGYGEGEITYYVFANSRLLSGEPCFVKITGRLIIVNISDICRRMKPEICYFNIPNRTIRDFYDTKLYAMPTEVFKKYFRKTYDAVWDEKGIYLERVYTKILSEQGVKVKNFPRYPRVIGMSGSTGLDYGYTEWTCKVRDSISILDGYKVNEK